jgi:hypothetical protein
MLMAGKKTRDGAAMPLLKTDTIEISGNEVALKRDQAVVMSVKIEDFLRTLNEASRSVTFPDGSALPGCVRFFYQRDAARVVVIELPHQVRNVRWISANSPVPFGPESKYDAVTLAFPYVVIAVLFCGPQLSGYQQLFYRTEPVVSETDSLLESNLLNVADGYGLQSWWCLQGMQRKDMASLTWNARIARVVEHFWEAGFNRSSEHHEFNSYWQKALKQKLDSRISSVEAWRENTAKDPTFVLNVPWKPAGHTILDVAEALLARAAAVQPPATATELATLLCRAALTAQRR